MPYSDPETALEPSINDIVPCIAPGIRINGEIRGTHDLYIDGEVTGSVFLPKNEVLVGVEADVHANIAARIIEVAGTVVGDLKAAERIVIRSSSIVQGDITAPQIQLEEGCQFKGSVQMCEPDVSTQPPVKPRVTGDPDSVRFTTASG